MENLTYNFIDKSEWGYGPWLDEPDKEQWQDPETALPCLAVRTQDSGHWCGYVGVPEGHPYFNRASNVCGLKDPCGEDWCNHRPEIACKVHGGITFEGFCAEGEPEHGICHIPGEGEPERVWWLGFDCNHHLDHAPGRDQAYHDPSSSYRRLTYVKSQCAGLANQLKEVSNA